MLTTLVLIVSDNVNYYMIYYFSVEEEGLEDLAKCTVPLIESHCQSKDFDSDAYQKVLEILRKESGPRFSVMKEDMTSIKEGGKGKSYSYLLENHISKFIVIQFKNLIWRNIEVPGNSFFVLTYIFPCRSKRSKLDGLEI